jgi:6-phosphofructokinase 1
MVALKGTEVITVPLVDVIGKPKLVNPRSEIVDAAKAIGIEFGA